MEAEDDAEVEDEREEDEDEDEVEESYLVGCRADDVPMTSSAVVAMAATVAMVITMNATYDRCYWHCMRELLLLLLL